MAKPKESSEPTKITRVKAKDDKNVAAKTPKVTSKKAVAVNGEVTESKQNAFKKFLGYFKGAWFELRQVRWPNRRQTWVMTAALLIFTAFFIVLILVTDIVWEYLFKLILE